MIVDLIIIFFLGCGALLMLIAALGVVRFPDLYTRMHAASKSISLGIGFLLLAAMVCFPTPAVILKSLAVVLFIFLTMPVASHMIGRAGYLRKVPLWENSILDEMASNTRNTNRSGNTGSE